MGVVYKARQRQLKRLVALKMILAGACADAVCLVRFRTEAEAAARLQHPHIVQIHEVGEHESLPFLSLEYVDGSSLEQKASEDPLPARDAARIVEAVARAIHNAHQHGILHRDLKPSNILLTVDGIPKVTDFGLAKLLDACAGPTPTEAFLGTPSYMAPEQAAGNTGSVGVGADVYGLGAILYALLTGEPPFKGTTLLNTLEKVRIDEPVPPARLRRGLPRDLEAICLRCLEKEPRRRYSSAEELADDLKRFCEGQPVQARRAGLIKRMWRYARRRPALVAKVVLGVTILCLATTSLWYVRIADQLAQHRAAEDYAQFIRLRDEALFYGLLAPDQGTFFTGGEREINLKRAETAAQKALALAGVGAADEVGTIDPRFPASRRSEVVEDCYALLLIVAEAESQRADLQSDERSRTALRTLDRAGQLGLDTRAYHLRRAALLERLGEAEKARSETERAEAKLPASSLDHFLLGEENYRRGAWVVARADFTQALATRPEHFWAQFFLAVCHLRLGEWEAARASFTACLARRNDFVWACLFRGFASEKLGAFQEAEKDFDNAFRLDPDDDARYTLLLTRGVLRFQQKQLEQAADDFRSAITLKPEQYNAYANLAWVHLAGGDFEQAATQVEAARRLNPPPLVFLGYHVERASRLCQGAKYKEALTDCAAALRVAPENPLTHGIRARCLLELQRYAEAERAYDDYLRCRGEPGTDVFLGRGLARMKQGHYPEAVDDYTRALDRRPDAELYLHRGWAHFFSDGWKLALRDFEKAIALRPDLDDAYTGRGLCRVMLGRYRQAVADAEEALHRRPETAEMMFNIACIFAQAMVCADADRDEEARQTLRNTYRRQALAALRQTLGMVRRGDRAAFWKEKVLSDSALAPIRGDANFRKIEKELVRSAE
jgi:tetratricopeptide (TPR) repeat protein